MSGATSAGLAVAGLVIVLLTANQWRRRTAITEQADRWFLSSDHRWRSINSARVQAGAVVLGMLGVLLVFTGIVNAVRALL